MTDSGAGGEGGKPIPPAARQERRPPLQVVAEGAALVGRPADEPAASSARAPGAAGARAPVAPRAPKPGPQKPAPSPELPSAVAPVAAPARARPRHWLAAGSFALLVVIPSLLAAVYLYVFAADQYASQVAFSIRGQENTSAPATMISALAGAAGVGAADAEIIYEFVRSQQMVEAAMEALPLVEIYNRPEQDIVFRLGRDRSIEDVTDYWLWMNRVSYDPLTGIVGFEARAFDPESARAVAGFVLEESTRVVNAMSALAREDAVKVARDALAEAEGRLRAARLDIRKFRDAEQEIDPSENARAALGLVATLRQELANAQVELDSYLRLVGPRGPRAPALRQRIESIERRIEEERLRVGAGGEGLPATDGGRAFSDLVADYEELAVDLEFAQNAYVSAMAVYEQAQVEARRQSRFLAPHVYPTLSVEARYPQRALLAVATFVVLAVAWAALALVFYNIRDRR